MQDVLTIGPKRYESRPVVSKLPHKRKLPDVSGDSSVGKRTKCGELVSKQLVCGYPSDHPFNKVCVCIHLTDVLDYGIAGIFCRVCDFHIFDRICGTIHLKYSPMVGGTP